jgi:hypothetical protein
MIAHFRKLWDDLARVREKVALLESPNPEDDRKVKFAIVGYSYHRPVESWGGPISHGKWTSRSICG